MTRIPPIFVTLLLLTGCFSTIPYKPDPARIKDPEAETLALINANVVQGCVVKPEFESRVLIVKFVCTQGMGNYVARLDQVESIAVQKMGSWYRVLVHHNSGVADFTWSSQSLTDMQRLADALTALSNLRAGGVAATGAPDAPPPAN